MTLDQTKVDEMRSLYAGGATCEQLGKIFGIGLGSAWRIVSGKSYASADYDPDKALADRCRALFWSNVKRCGVSDCWPWIGHRQKRYGRGHKTKTGNGYGRTAIDGRRMLSHRAAFFLTHGRDPIGVLRHKCDNPPCCNPNHLIEGTQRDNVNDAKERGLLPVGEDSPGARLT